MKLFYSITLLLAVIALIVILLFPFAMFFDETPLEQLYGTVFSLALFGLPWLAFGLYFLPSPFTKGKPQNAVN